MDFLHKQIISKCNSKNICSFFPNAHRDHTIIFHFFYFLHKIIDRIIIFYYHMYYTFKNLNSNTNNFFIENEKFILHSHSIKYYILRDMIFFLLFIV